MFCKIGNKLLVLYNVLAGYCIKWKTDIFGPGKLYPLERKNEGENIIISLTSYGRRVQKTVYYTLVSLLKQTLPANRIILWLSADNWSDETLPKRLKKLKEYGVEYGFCKDLRSYTKLIPSLKAAPKDLIVTVDDDMIYSRILLQTLYKEHKKYPDCICCMEALMPAHSDKSSFLPYRNWKEAKHSDTKEDRVLFPLGVGGVLYPPGALHKDVLLEDCFTELCPAADDIWFWAMARQQGTACRLVPEKTKKYSFDALYQFFHKNSALTHDNRKRNMNDVQLYAVLKKYPVL